MFRSIGEEMKEINGKMRKFKEKGIENQNNLLFGCQEIIQNVIKAKIVKIQKLFRRITEEKKEINEKMRKINITYYLVARKKVAETMK